MSDKADISLEQSFRLEVIKDQIYGLGHREAQEYAIALHRQMIQMKNQFTGLLAAGAGEPMALVEVELPDRDTLLEEARKLPGTRITWHRETGTGSAVPYCAHPGQPWARYTECLFYQPDRPDMSPGMPTWQLWVEAGWKTVAGVQNNV